MVAPSKFYQDKHKTEVSTLGFPAIGSWPFPLQLLEFYRRKGISTLFKWQLECLALPGVLDGCKNLLFAAPTSAGKTLVAEVLMWKRLLETKRKAIYVIPFVSVGREKVTYLQALFKMTGLKVDTYIGSQNSIAGIRSWDIAVCTIEKANNLINRCIEENTLDLIGMIVIDEFHIIGDAQRGYLVELLVTKVLQMLRLKSLTIQIVAMSATISNLTFLSRWLQAVEYTTTFRPVALLETLYNDGCFYDREMNKVRVLSANCILPNDQDNIVGLCLETVLSGFGVLVFCATKAWCEKLSETIASTFNKIIRKSIASSVSDQLRTILNAAVSSTFFLDEYKRLVGVADQLLLRTLPYAVGFHHAGLTMEEREQLERGFRNGHIRVLVATSTLSSGVNLPARRVIIRSPWGQTGSNSGLCLTHASYKQMIGRAGRQGFDVEGESIIVCKRHEIKRGLDLMNGTLESVGSALLNIRNTKESKNENKEPCSRFKRAMLEALVGSLAKSMDEAVEYAKCTLIAAELVECENSDTSALHNVVEGCMDYLLKKQFITLDGEKLSSTQLGRATLASAMNPEEAWFMFEDLKKAHQSLVLDTELHMVYLVTPTYMQDQWGMDFDWYNYHRIYCKLSTEERRVADLVGISEAFLLGSTHRRSATSANASGSSDAARKYAIHMRFYIALALANLIGEIPLSNVAEKFGCNRGFLQALQQQASTYAGMAVAFCDRLGWWYMKTLLAGFAERIAFGVRRELTELVQIDGVDGSRARCFHHSGFTTLASIVYAQPNDIAVALRKAVPFKSDHDSNTTLKRSWLSGHPDMTEDEAVSFIQTRAKRILEENLGRLGISLGQCQATSLENTSTPNSVSTDGQGLEKPNDQRSIEQVNVHQPSGDESINKQSTAQSLAKTNTLPDNEQHQVIDSVTPQCDIVKGNELNEQNNNGLDEVLIHMSRFSITPRSTGDDTPTSSKRNSIKSRFDLEITETQFAKIFSDSMNGSPILRHVDNVSPTITSSHSNDNRNVITTNCIYTCDNLPASFSNSEAESIQNQSKEEQPLNSSDIDLFDSGVPTSDVSELSDVLIDGNNDDEVETVSPILQADSTSSESTLPLSCDQEPSSTADLFQTPILFNRKRQRPHRRNSDYSTPSPLIRKCSKYGENRSGSESSSGHQDSLLDKEHSRLLEDDNEFTIVSPCSDLDSFEKFSVEWPKQSRFAIVFAVRREPAAVESIKNMDKLVKITGVAISWSSAIVYYLPLMDEDLSSDNQHSTNVPLKDRLDLLKLCLCSTAIQNEKIVFDFLQLQKLLRAVSIGSMVGTVHCLKVADWLLTCGSDDIPLVKNANSLIDRYSPKSSRTTTSGSLNIDVETCSNASGMIIAWREIQTRLKNRQLWTAFVESEMPAVKVVAQMEENGIGFDFTTCQSLSSNLRMLSDQLENRAYNLAERPFSLTSYAELAKILFVELKLPANGTSSSRRGHKQASKRHYSTSKEILEKLRPLHALPGVVLDWRKLHSALSTAIFPLLSRSSSNSEIENRIFGTFDWYTATGRIIMHEPSFQLMPRSFNISNEHGKEELVNIRNLIISEPGFVLISADYSQLELRILAHLSEDQRLIEILSSADGDVFRIIAAAWLNLVPEKIDDEQRQRAKKLCYGVIYGMGVRTLADELDVSEETAAGFMDAFKLQFPNVFRWMTEVIEKTREEGFVKTLNGRMRHLPAIRNNCVVDQRLHAERQAINTSVQGSAADVFKAALRNVNEALLKTRVVGETDYRIILQLHDELIIEAKEYVVDEVARTVQREMETCYQLRVPLRVRLNSGLKWGSLKSIIL